MASKIPFILGLGAGYVLGTRAGRAQYERIKAAAARIVERPSVRNKVDSASTKASNFVRQQGEAVTDKVAEAVKDRLFGGAPTSRKTSIPLRCSSRISFFSSVPS